MNDTGEYQLHVLGTFTLERGGQIVKFPRRKATALFAYLALHPQVHTRDQLDTLLWGDYLDDEARQSLRTALSTIRREVGDDVLIVDNETVRLNPTFPLWVDAVSFETYAKRFLAEPPFDLSTAFIDLYEGDLLPDVYDDWVVAEREHLHSLYVAVLLQTAEQMRSRSEYGRALDFAQRVLAIEPSNERAHQHVMFCYVAKGDRTAALRQYETCEAVLQNDLGVEPMPETRSLYQWIKGQPAHAAAKEARITNLPLPLTSFIGRERETAEIKRALSQHRLVTLTGMGGSGKTRLAIQVASDLVDMYKNGVWFVDLARVQNPSSVVNAAAQALGAPIAPNQPAAEALVAFLHSRHILIVLDNCEHVIGACAEVADDAVRSCPKVSILTTSREPLNVTGEIVRLVPPLPVPAADVIPQSLAALSPCAATQLFVQRATMA
jgi:DNA-binding SARP family transcriptional activator